MAIDLSNFTMVNMIKGWNDNQELIKDYIQNRERFTDNNTDNKDAAAVLGIGVGFFLILFLLSVILFFVSIYLLVVNWDILPNWAKVIGLVSLFFFPLFTVIVVLVAKQQGGLDNRLGGDNRLDRLSSSKPSVRFRSPPVNYGLHNRLHYGLHNGLHRRIHNRM